jgi:hypothetical protein
MKVFTDCERWRGVVNRWREVVKSVKGISVKTINGKRYVYSQYKKDGRVITKYLGKEDEVGFLKKVVVKIRKAWERKP